MLPNVKQWDMRALYELFDCAEIVHVSLVEEVIEDKLIQKEKQSGCYSVRLGYRLWRNACKGGRGRHNLLNWNSLWNIKAAARAKHFIWRICRGCLPSRVRLCQHHVPCPVECPFCNNSLEDEWQIFFGCAAINQGWQAACLSNIIDNRLLSFDEVKLLIFDICTKEDRNTAGRVAVMLEGMWKNRNNFIWNNEKEEATKVGWLAYHKWQEWFTVHNNSDDHTVSQHVQTWEPPPPEWLKCNVDADFNKIGRTSNRGWCISDSSGNFHTAGTTWNVGEYTILEGEALALKDAIQIANQHATRPDYLRK
ncbi:uncharacterized protein LOC131619641 [Vicia villosa]|uniref:uncharacterized protein LOC131619641 n=1 Tax=Vicia villosa TaxID=3911 RepID=UPI00273A76D7|nr:uncharacterized protein LOC131619641 [Vicia villosa]